MTTPHPNDELNLATGLLRRARRITVLSGASLSKASGIPTYRETGGLWSVEDSLRFSNVNAYTENPRAFAAFWASRTAQMKTVAPNPAHMALAALQGLRSTALITQNVDGLLTQAGCEDVIELHGNLHRHRCDNCGILNGRAFVGRCLGCWRHIRPDIVLFGEQLDKQIFIDAQVAASDCDVMLVVGTAAIVERAASLPVTAMQFGARVIVIDVEDSLLSKAADIVLKGEAEVLLPKLIDRLRAGEESDKLLKSAVAQRQQP
jgi:NAD-dependent deacetylase